MTHVFFPQKGHERTRGMKESREFVSFSKVINLTCFTTTDITYGYGMVLKVNDFLIRTPARQATFDFSNKYRQMESSDVIKKILRVVNRVSH
jgi:hypothetical protein